jgi:hypothetical protein
MKFSPAQPLQSTSTVQPFSPEQPLSHRCLWPRSKAAPLFLLLCFLSLSLPRDCVVPHPAAFVWRVLGNGEELGSRGFHFQLGKKCINLFPLCSCIFLCISFSDRCQSCRESCCSPDFFCSVLVSSCGGRSIKFWGI